MKGLPEAETSRAVLIGVARYTGLETLPAVSNNLPALADALTSPGSWGLAREHCAVVAEPSGLHEVLEPVEEAARAARDTLLVYFAGHGLTDDRGELFLGLPRSRPGHGHTGVPYAMLRSAIMSGRAQRHVIILDCCFSGRALGTMGGSVADQAQIDGSYLLAAAPETGVALAPPGEQYTAFTGELLDVLKSGIEGGEAWLDLESVYRRLRSVLAAKSRPLPQKRDRNTAGGLLLGRNNAYRPWTSTAVAAAGSGARWPDPDVLDTAQEFIEALGHVRAISGRSIQAVSDNARPSLSPSAVSALLNRRTLPRSWKSTEIYLHACGLPADQVQRWQVVWERIRVAAATQPDRTIQKSGERTPQSDQGWRTWFSPRRQNRH
ncbi:caspase family protein [Kitasatospora sp. NPDC001095]